jgi:hypothetical protein
MESKRNPNREFSAEVRKAERESANNSCRICGKSKDDEWLQHAHIYTLSTNHNWERKGSDIKKWHDDNYVNSVNNCVALCKTHHGKIDSKLGLQNVSVGYLESLKMNQGVCTALIGAEWRRCQKKIKGYRCNIHTDGGLEETLVARKWGNAKKEVINARPKSRGCIIM